MVLKTPTHSQDSKIKESRKKEVIEEISQLLKDKYLYEDEAKKIGDFLRSNQASGEYSDLNSASAFARRLTTDIQNNFKDKHLRIRFQPKAARQIQKLDKELANTPSDNGVTNSEIERLLAIEIYENFRLPEVKRLSGNIGYIKLDQFLPPKYARGYREKMDAVFQFVIDTDALILDLRENPGGYDEGVEFLLSYFFEAGVHISNTVARIDGKTVTDKNYIKGKEGPRYLEKPVFILTSYRTASAAESVSHAIKYSGRGTVVGQNTFGAGYLGNDHAVADEYIVTVSYAAGMHPNAEENWEGSGVQPDIDVSYEETLVKARLTAVNEVLKLELEKEKGEQYEYRVNTLQWERDRLQDLAKNASLETEEAEQFIGAYENRKIFRDGQNLYYQLIKPERPARRMIPVEKDRFLLEGLENYRLDFERDKMGELTQLRLYTLSRLLISKKTK